MTGGKTLDAGQTAPNFRLETLDGRTAELSEILARGPVLLAFYKVSCPTCQLTLPFLNRFRHTPLQVFAISQNPPDLADEFNREFGVEVAGLIDKAEDGYPASNAYGLTHVPTMFLVEPEGKITWSSIGFSKKDLQDLGERFGVALFRPEDRVPDFKGG